MKFQNITRHIARPVFGSQPAVWESLLRGKVGVFFFEIATALHVAVLDFACVFLSIELNGIDDGVLTKALRVLEKRQQAEILTLDGGSGVKFFS